MAVAIIKSKPPGRSGRQYAEQLAARFNLFESSWKTKAEGLQEEVLRLRQELLLSEMLSKPDRNSEQGGCGLSCGLSSIAVTLSRLLVRVEKRSINAVHLPFTCPLDSQLLLFGHLDLWPWLNQLATLSGINSVQHLSTI